jgi:GT2 family glycosyltransferase
MDKCAVVILNWNGLRFLKSFLPEVLKHSQRENISVYVADNGSSDASVEYLSDNFKDVRILRFENNLGFAGGYNLALQQIESEYYLLLNSDIEVTHGWIDPLLNIMQDNPDLASCQPKVLSFAKKEYFEYAGAAGGYLDKYGYPLCRGRIFYQTEKDSGQYNDVKDIFWSTGACMMVRSAAWKKCGGFDSRFFAHMEEIDLCWRFHRAGYGVAYVPDSVVYHVGGGSLPYDSPFKTFLNFRNSLFMLYKNLPEKNFGIKLFRRMIFDGIAALFFLLKGQVKSFTAVWKAHIDFYRNLPGLRKSRLEDPERDKGNFRGLILNKSIIVEFYFKKNRTFSSLNKN